MPKVAAKKFVSILFLAMFAACASSSATTDNFDGARNENALQTARENIEKFRKGDARIKIVDGRGKPVSAKLKIKQTSHAFKFGGYLKIDDLAAEKLPEYERNFKSLFNFAVVGTYWDFVETKRGAENWQWFERETALGEKMNLRIQAAPVLWGTIEFGTPKWLPRKKEELQTVLDNHVRKVLRKNQKNVEDWEIVNEPLAPKPDFFAAYSGKDYIAKAFRTARETSPNARLMINEYGIFGADKTRNYNRERYFDLVKELLEKNAPVDVVGIQAHANGEWFSPENVADELNRYAALGKPIQITEFSAQTLEFEDRKTPLKITGNYRSGIWDDEKQAEFYREFYTVAFGSKSVEAITAWGLDDERAWLPGVGLIDEKGNAKPNYKTLDRLINHEWRTNLDAATDADGQFEFRGFYGAYEIEAASPNGKISTVKFNLEKNGANDLTIRLN